MIYETGGLRGGNGEAGQCGAKSRHGKTKANLAGVLSDGGTFCVFVAIQLS
jgi:hypothetical protein